MKRSKKIIAILLTCLTAFSLIFTTSCSFPKFSEMFCKHKYSEEVTTKPTCVKDGEKTLTCTLCGKVIKEKVDATGHTVVEDKAVAPTCDKNGKTQGERCGVCNVVLKEQEIVPAFGHDLEIIPGKAPTCTEKGLTDWAICTVCEKVIIEQQEIPQLDCEDLDGDLLCDVCQQYITARMKEVDVEVGESVAGHWYRLYKYNVSTYAVKLANVNDLSESYDFSNIYLYNRTTGEDLSTNSSGGYLFTYMPGYKFDNHKYIYTDEYIDIYIGKGSTISMGSGVCASITADTVIADIAEGVVFKRLV